MLRGAIEMIFPDFVRDRIRLQANYDEAWGYSLLSDSTEADDFLKGFAGALIKSHPQKQPPSRE